MPGLLFQGVGVGVLTGSQDQSWSSSLFPCVPISVLGWFRGPGSLTFYGHHVIGSHHFQVPASWDTVLDTVGRWGHGGEVASQQVQKRHLNKLAIG